MNIAILTVSSLSLVASVGTLLIMAKTARELQMVKAEVESTVADVQTKVKHNAKVIGAAFGALEI